MDNKAQSNARKLIKILTEDKYKKRRAPAIISLGAFALVLVTVLFFRNTHKTQESYLITRADKLNFKDIDNALKANVNFESLGEKKKHILYYLAVAPYSLEVISYLKKSGVDLKALNNEKRNALEDILLNLSPSHKNLEEDFYKNISTLISLELTASDDVIKEASSMCEKSSLITCLKVAYYFKAIGRMDFAKSYGQRSCYTSSDDSICAISKNYILKD